MALRILSRLKSVRPAMKKEKLKVIRGTPGQLTMEELTRAFQTATENIIENKKTLEEEDATRIGEHLSEVVNSATAEETQTWLRQILGRGATDEHVISLANKFYKAGI